MYNKYYKERNKTMYKNNFTDIYLKIIKESNMIEGLDHIARAKVASDPSTPFNVLYKLSRDQHYWVRQGVAENPNCPSEILQKLSNDEEWMTRGFVASNLNCSKETLKKLSRDQNYVVRYHVAENSNCPLEILQKLSDDEDYDVRETVVRNPKCPIEIIKKYKKSTKEDNEYSIILKYKDKLLSYMKNNNINFFELVDNECGMGADPWLYESDDYDDEGCPLKENYLNPSELLKMVAQEISRLINGGKITGSKQDEKVLFNFSHFYEQTGKRDYQILNEFGFVKQTLSFPKDRYPTKIADGTQRNDKYSYTESV